jgi:hypothetical protein
MYMSSANEAAQSVKTGRRNVVRGAAWTIPVVAISATAPAFATSPTPPNFGKLTACKIPGASGDLTKGYKFTVPYNGTLDQVTNLSLTLNGASKTTECLSADGSNLTFYVVSSSSADGSGTGTVQFTFGGQLYTQSFTYDGTKPCPGNERKTGCSVIDNAA